MSEKMMPRVGIGCWIFNPYGRILMGKRLSEHGYGTWAVPGGHLEIGENPKHAAMRELLEETGIKVPQEDFVLFAITNDLFQNEQNILVNHYITLHYVAYDISDIPKVMEPDKCEKWMWHSMYNLPSQLFLPTKNALEYLQPSR